MIRSMCVRIAGALTLMLVLAGYANPSFAQFKNSDQVGVVVPAFETDGKAGTLGLYVAYAIKNGIQRQLSSQDPVTRERGIGHGISYFIPKPMATSSHRAAASLAQGNGLQATLWGVAQPLVDGVAIESFLTLAPPYTDYRNERREIWSAKIDGVDFRLAPPRQAISFSATTFSTSVVKKYGNLKGIRHCRLDKSRKCHRATGQCRYFNSYQVGRVFEFKNGCAILRRGRIDYAVEFPNAELLRSEAIDYAALFVAYSRGNLRHTVRLATKYLERHSSAPVRIDVFLYRGAARARLGDFEAAAKDFDSAMKLNPFARRILRYSIMLELVRNQGKSTRAKQLLDTFLQDNEPQTEFDKAAITLFSQ